MNQFERINVAHLAEIEQLKKKHEIDMKTHQYEFDKLQKLYERLISEELPDIESRYNERITIMSDGHAQELDTLKSNVEKSYSRQLSQMKAEIEKLTNENQKLNKMLLDSEDMCSTVTDMYVKKTTQLETALNRELSEKQELNEKIRALTIQNRDLINEQEIQCNEKTDMQARLNFEQSELRNTIRKIKSEYEVAVDKMEACISDMSSKHNSEIESKDAIIQSLKYYCRDYDELKSTHATNTKVVEQQLHKIKYYQRVCDQYESQILSLKQKIQDLQRTLKRTTLSI